MAAVGGDILAQRRDLERHAVGDKRYRSMLEPGRHGVQFAALGCGQHGFGRRAGRNIDIVDGLPEQRIAHRAPHGTADAPRRRQGGEHAAKRRRAEPGRGSEPLDLGRGLHGLLAPYFLPPCRMRPSL